MHDSTAQPQASPSRLTSRRQLAKGIAWAAPVAAAATAAPAYAASRDEVAYRFRTSVFSEFSYDSYTCTTSSGFAGHTLNAPIYFNNVDYPGTAGNTRGFTVAEMPMQPSGQKSPTTTASLNQPVQLVVAYPRGMVYLANGRGADGNYYVNGFCTTTGSATWSGPTHRTATMAAPDGTRTYDVFTFTFTGNHTQSTVPNRIGTTATQHWSGSQLAGFFDWSTSYCSPVAQPWYYANYYLGSTVPATPRPTDDLGGFSTANGFTGTVSGGIGWVRLTAV